MEFPQTGERCGVKDCCQLDFLPIECSHCKMIFCRVHSFPDSHDCASAPNNVVTEKKAFPSLTCSQKGCKETSPVELLCSTCSTHFCPSHRHHGCSDPKPNLSKSEKHRAAKEEFSKVKAETDKMVQNRLDTTSNRIMANKIKLMKIKGSAVGDNSVPVNDRVFFAVCPPLQSKPKSQARSLFVSKTWTLGKTVDVLAKRLKLNNMNNEPTKPQLVLLTSSGCPLSLTSSTSIESLLQNGSVINGDSLILEYIEPLVLSKSDLTTLIPPENISSYNFT